jgi:hypothetical protein
MHRRVSHAQAPQQSNYQFPVPSGTASGSIGAGHPNCQQNEGFMDFFALLIGIGWGTQNWETLTRLQRHLMIIGVGVVPQCNKNSALWDFWHQLYKRSITEDGSFFLEDLQADPCAVNEYQERRTRRSATLHWWIASLISCSFIAL